MNIANKLIELGGKEWKNEKHNRVYFSKEVFIAYAEQKGITAVFADGLSPAVKRISTKDRECKAWFNVETQKFESLKPSIQYYFDSYANVEDAIEVAPVEETPVSIDNKLDLDAIMRCNVKATKNAQTIAWHIVQVLPTDRNKIYLGGNSHDQNMYLCDAGRKLCVTQTGMVITSIDLETCTHDEYTKLIRAFYSATKPVKATETSELSLSPTERAQKIEVNCLFYKLVNGFTLAILDGQSVEQYLTKTLNSFEYTQIGTLVNMLKFHEKNDALALVNSILHPVETVEPTPREIAGNELLGKIEEFYYYVSATNRANEKSVFKRYHHLRHQLITLSSAGLLSNDAVDTASINLRETMKLALDSGVGNHNKKEYLITLMRKHLNKIESVRERSSAYRDLGLKPSTSFKSAKSGTQTPILDLIRASNCSIVFGIEDAIEANVRHEHYKETVFIVKDDEIVPVFRAFHVFKKGSLMLMNDCSYVSTSISFILNNKSVSIKIHGLDAHNEMREFFNLPTGLSLAESITDELKILGHIAKYYK